MTSASTYTGSSQTTADTDLIVYTRTQSGSSTIAAANRYNQPGKFTTFIVSTSSTVRTRVRLASLPGLEDGVAMSQRPRAQRLERLAQRMAKRSDCVLHADGRRG